MILLANGWHPDVVAGMQKRLGGKVYRVADCTWVRTNQKELLEYELERKILKLKEPINERRQYPYDRNRRKSLSGEDRGETSKKGGFHQAPQWSWRLVEREDHGFGKDI